jgi:glycosyltransferase involved in cell wall biosynthesis
MGVATCQRPPRLDCLVNVISFIVPAYNEELELPATLRAIYDAATQASEEFEVIVVDDASTDTTANIARDAGAKVVSINRRQIAASRNAGARVARGEILFFVDADTRINAVHVREGIAALRSGFAGGSARIRVDDNVPWLGHAFLKLFSAIYFAGKLGAGAFIFATRQNFETVGGFDEQYFAGEEVFLSLALKKLGKFKILPEPMITSGRKLRMHSGWHLWRRSIRMMLGGLSSYRSRDQLDLWYDGKRESTTV